METIIGLGQAGCNVAEKFMQHSEYQVYRIDSKKRPGKKFKLLPLQKTHEEYEEKCPSFKRFFGNITDECLFVLAGGGKITGAALRILQQLNSKSVNILYIRPDISLLSEIKKRRERLVFHVLQQYTRSALFNKMYVVDNKKLQEILENVPVVGFYDKLNELIVSTMHMVNYCNNTDAEFDTFSDSLETARISTFGICDVETGEEKLFYDLQKPREKLYYYLINQDKLEEETGLLGHITTQVRERSDENIRSYFGIYSADYDNDYACTIANSSMIQDEFFIDV